MAIDSLALKTTRKAKLCKLEHSSSRLINYAWESIGDSPDDEKSEDDLDEDDERVRRHKLEDGMKDLGKRKKQKELQRKSRVFVEILRRKEVVKASPSQNGPNRNGEQIDPAWDDLKFAKHQNNQASLLRLVHFLPESWN